MCVSATASFTIATLLIPAGAYSTWKTIQRGSPAWPLAAFPIAFGMQQALEGLVWLEIDQQSNLMYVASLGFLFFALFFWPVWVPFSAYWAEDRNSKRKKTLKVLTILGFIYGMLEYSAVVFHVFEWLDVTVKQGSIKYQFSINLYSRNLFIAMYSLLIIVPLVVSTKRSMKVLGLFIAITVALSYYLYGHAFISVWCFIAAVISTLTFYFTYKEAY